MRQFRAQAAVAGGHGCSDTLPETSSGKVACPAMSNRHHLPFSVCNSFFNAFLCMTAIYANQHITD